MKYGKKESGHERKSPEGLAMLGGDQSKRPFVRTSPQKIVKTSPLGQNVPPIQQSKRPLL